MTDRTDPGWYEDPEAPDLLRWWNGSDWSDTEFRTKPEGSALMAHLEGYRDLSPTSPTNYLATSSMVSAWIELAASLLLLAVVWFLPSSYESLAGATILLIASSIVFGLVVFTLITSVLSVINARRNGGRHMFRALSALVIAGMTLAAITPVLLWLVPAWIAAPV